MMGVRAGPETARVSRLSPEGLQRATLTSLTALVDRLAAACFNSCRRTAESIPSFCAISRASSSRTMRLGTR